MKHTTNNGMPNMRHGRIHMQMAVMAVAILGISGVFASDDYVVSEDTEVAAQKNVGNVTVNANLTVNSVKFLPDANTATYLPGTSGVTPQIVVTGTGGVYNEGSSNKHTVRVGLNGGSGCLVVRNGATARANTLQVEENASDPSTPGTNTVLRLESNGMAIIDKGMNLNSNAVARIVFAGGRMRGAKPFVTSGTHWLVEAEPGKDIKFIDQALQQINATESDSKNGTVTFKTDRDIVVGDNGSSRDYPTLHGRLLLNAATNRIIWAHSGDIVISNNAQLVVQADESLPNGLEHGGIRIVKTMTDQEYFTSGRKELPNILVGLAKSGITTSCNWIDVQDGFLSNRVMTAEGESTIRMGVWGEDTSFKGHVIGPVKIEKHGSGKILLGDAFLPKFHLLSGSAEIIAGKTNDVSRIDSIKTGDATSLAVLTGDLEYGGNGETNCVRSLSVAAGHELRLLGGASLSVDTLAVDGTIVKDGAGTFDLNTDEAVAPKVRVDGGVYRPGGITTTNRWWRFTFKKAKQDSFVNETGCDAPATETLSLGKIHLFGYGPDQTLSDLTPPLNLNLALDETRTGKEDDLSGMAAGTIASSPWFVYSRGTDALAEGAHWTNAVSLTLPMKSTWVDCMVFTSKVVQIDNPDTWVTVAFRLKDDNSVIRSYCIGGAAGNGGARYIGATHWKVESSPTGKPGTWVLMDERAGETPNHSVTSASHLFTYYNGLHPYMLHAPVRTDSFDISSVSATGTGSVDLSNVPDSALTSSELTVDFSAGGGVYTKYAFGANGTLNLVNVPENTRLGPKTSIPVSLGQMSGSENLRNWTVTVDGVLMPDLKLMYKDGSLCFRPNGFVLTFR